MRMMMPAMEMRLRLDHVEPLRKLLRAEPQCIGDLLQQFELGLVHVAVGMRHQREECQEQFDQLRMMLATFPERQQRLLDDEIPLRATLEQRDGLAPVLLAEAKAGNDGFGLPDLAFADAPVGLGKPPHDREYGFEELLLQLGRCGGAGKRRNRREAAIEGVADGNAHDGPHQAKHQKTQNSANQLAKYHRHRPISARKARMITSGYFKTTGKYSLDEHLPNPPLRGQARESCLHLAHTGSGAARRAPVALVIFLIVVRNFVMMKKALAAAISLAISVPALATQFNASGARSVAMGGVGVASGRGVEGAFYNPALLSAQKKSSEYELILPYFSIVAADDDNLIDEFDDFDDKVDALDDAIDRFEDIANSVQNASFDVADAVAAVANVGVALADVNAELASFNNKALRVDPGIGAGFAKPGKEFGFALYAYNETKIAGRFLYSGSDLATIENYVADLGALADDIADGSVNFNDYSNIYDPAAREFITPDFASSIALVGLAISEVGVALSREFEIAGRAVSLGVTPKLVRVDAAMLGIVAVEEDENGDLTSGLDDFEDKYDDTKADDTSVNVDIGAAMQVGEFLLGATVRNLIPQDYDLESEALPNLVYEMKPHARAGAMWSNDWIVVAADVDLTEQESLIRNINLATRFLSIGAEFKFWDRLYLRAGYRDNLGSAELDTLSLGFGVDFGLTLDFAIIASEDGDEAGFSAQIGGRW
jgi:hypothetical protein